MLDIILNILSILGIILLILLAIVIILLVLVLFFPIFYKVSGEKTTEKMFVEAKFHWLLGFIRGRFLYPEPGNFLIKCLWFTLFDSKAVKDENTDNHSGEQENLSQASEAAKPVPTEEPPLASEILTPASEQKMTQSAEETLKEESITEETSQKGLKAFITAKYEKIKYTILKIYDKIKHIWENITFYRDLLADEQTKGLFSHGWMRLKKILKNIRPRKLKANITFGAASPDSTGYAMAIYGMLSPLLGKHINITPDFTQAIFLGDFYAAGHITIFQLLFHSLMVLFDKRLKLLKTRLQRHKNQMN